MKIYPEINRLPNGKLLVIYHIEETSQLMTSLGIFILAVGGIAIMLGYLANRNFQYFS